MPGWTSSVSSRWWWRRSCAPRSRRRWPAGPVGSAAEPRGARARTAGGAAQPEHVEAAVHVGGQDEVAVEGDSPDLRAWLGAEEVGVDVVGLRYELGAQRRPVGAGG